MITLYQFEPAFGLPNASPFCMKLETYLRMAGLPFEVPKASMRQFARAPKGKMPYIEDQGELLADTSFIIDHLERSCDKALDAWLTPQQRAVALAFQRLIEENLYWAMVYTRWVEPEGWALTQAAFFSSLPAPARWIVPSLARRGIIKELAGHGMGRHNRADVYAIGKRDITALANFLGDKHFFMGDQPCTLDATAYATLANLLWAPVKNGLQQHAQQFAPLQTYCERMRNRYYP